MPPPSHRHRRHRTKNPRPLGAFLFIMGAFLLYVCEIMPVLDARQHRPELDGTFSGKGIIAGFAFFVFGLALLIGGAPVLRFMNQNSGMNPPSGKSKVLAYIVAFLAVGGGVLLYFCTRAWLESQGYSFSFYPRH